MRRRDAGQLLEVITGAEALRQHLRQIQTSVREEMLWFCKAQYVAMPSGSNTEEFEALARGCATGCCTRRRSSTTRARSTTSWRGCGPVRSPVPCRNSRCAWRSRTARWPSSRSSPGAARQSGGTHDGAGQGQQSAGGPDRAVRAVLGGRRPAGRRRLGRTLRDRRASGARRAGPHRPQAAVAAGGGSGRQGDRLPDAAQPPHGPAPYPGHDGTRQRRDPHAARLAGGAAGMVVTGGGAGRRDTVDSHRPAVM